MYIIMAIMPGVFGNSESDIFYYAWQVLLWGIMGGVFGWVIWSFSERQYIKGLK